MKSFLFTLLIGTIITMAYTAPRHSCPTPAPCKYQSLQAILQDDDLAKMALSFRIPKGLKGKHHTLDWKQAEIQDMDEKEEESEKGSEGAEGDLHEDEDQEEAFDVVSCIRSKVAGMDEEGDRKKTI